MTTYTLLYTLLAAAVLYYLCPLRLRWMLLLALSYILYAQNGRQALAFILLTTLSTWAGALLIGRIGVEDLRDLLPDLESGMRPKMEACIRAIDGGVRQAHIIDGRKPHSILNEIFTSAGIGTMVEPGEGLEMRSSYGN